MTNHCPTTDATRIRCAVVSPTYTRVDPVVADLVQSTLGRGTHVRAILAGAPSSGSSLRGRASHYGGSYAATRARWYARLAAVGVPVVRRSEGRRVVLCLGPAYAPCVGARTGEYDHGRFWVGVPNGGRCYSEHGGIDAEYPLWSEACLLEPTHHETGESLAVVYRRECSGAQRPWSVVRLVRVG